MSGFGFQVPQGDAGALDAAAGSWRTLAAALGAQGECVSGAAQVALGAGGWDGPAAGAFAGSSEELIGAMRADVEACGQAASALSELSRALEHAQQVTRQALAQCEQSQAEATRQQQAADQAGQAAQTARAAIPGAAHPAAALALAREATAAEQQQGAAQGAAARAQGDLSAAQTRGQQAVEEYDRIAHAVAGRLRSAAGELRAAPELGKGWAEPVVGWAGHVNDFAGAGAVGLIKGYDSALAVAGAKLASETEKVLADPAALSSIEKGLPISGVDGVDDPLYGYVERSGNLARSPLTRALTAGLPEDTFGVLGKVPYLAAGVTAVDMFMNRDEGVGKAVVEPVGNLVASTAIAEGTSSLVATGVTSLAAGDGALAAIAGTTVIPGVGEVVIVGVAAVGGTILLDKGATWVWDHGGEHVAKEAWHGIEDAGSWVENKVTHPLSTAKQVVHDLEPWNW